MKQVELKLQQGRFEVLRTENGSNWTVAFHDTEIEPAEIILKAFVDVGYVDVTKL